MDTLYLATALAIFVAVALLVEGVCIFWNSTRGADAQRIARRLRSIAGEHGAGQPAVSIQRRRVFSELPLLHRVLQPLRLAKRLDTLLLQSGGGITVAQFLGLTSACGLAVLAVLVTAGAPFLLAAPAAGAASAMPLILVAGRKRRRLARLEQQLPEALELMSRALRAGHALPSCIRMVCDDMPEPISGEFRIVFNEVQYGVALREALTNLSARIPGSDVAFFVVAVLIQRETGGNLAELLDTIAGIIRERFKLFAQVQVYSAEGRLSAWILGLLPFLLGGVLHMVNPGFMKTLGEDAAGRQLLGGVLVLMVLGIFWMRKVIRIHV